MAVLPLEITANDKILVVAPHPDDESIGCGGLLALYPNQVEIVVLTDGRLGSKDNNPDGEAIIRKEQFLKLIELSGIQKFYWQGIRDGNLSNHVDCVDNMDFSKYTKIFLPGLFDDHPDHTAANFIVSEVLRKKGIKSEIYQYEVHVPFRSITHFLDITNVLDKKLNFIRCHRDQIINVKYDYLTKALNQYRACQMNLVDGYCEGYVKITLSDDSNDVMMREKLLQKYQLFNRTLTDWLKNEITGKHFSMYFEQNHLNSVSIYGYAAMGKLLAKELMLEGINVIDVFDKRKILIDETLKQHTKLLSEGTRAVDIVIVTAVYDYDEIAAELMALNYKRVMSLQKLIEGVNDLGD